MGKRIKNSMKKEETIHKAGFVNIFGLPNVGKSTLMNALIGEKLSIVTPKAQTTRKRIIGILNDADFQMVFNDTPGILEPTYKMQESMAGVVKDALDDADVALYLIEANMNEMTAKSQLESIKTNAPLILVVNKIDTLKSAVLQMKLMFWEGHPQIQAVVAVSALNKLGLANLLKEIQRFLPEGPAFYPKDELSDRNVRFFVADFIREKIFLHLKDEIPYHTEVHVIDYEEKPDIDVIQAEIYVNRESHKSILIGKAGALIKKISTEARLDIEKFVNKKVFLEIRVKVKENWINNENTLRNFGY
jgi:GTP-binding protein Era